MITIPTIHINGSDKKELLARLRTAIKYIDAAIDAVRQTAPNGRDYYPQGSAAFQEAREAFHLRLGKLCEVKGELTEIALGIIPQGRDAGEGGEVFGPAPAATSAEMAAHIRGMQEALDIIRSRPRIELPTDDPEVVTITWPSNLEAAIYVEARIAELLEGGASIWHPMADAPTDGTPILARIKNGLTVTVDGVEQPFWWSGKCAVVSPVVTGEPRWELHALDSWWCFGEHEIEGWTPLPGGETVEARKGGAQ